MLTESSPIRRPPPEYPETRSLLGGESSLLSLPLLWAPPPRPLSAKGERDRRPGSCDGQLGMQSLNVYLATIVVSCAVVGAVIGWLFPSTREPVEPVSAARGHTPHLSHVTAFYARELHRVET